MPKLPHIAEFFQGAASLLIKSFKRYPLEVMLCPLPGQMITATRVSGDKPAKITMLCPDGWSKNINGNVDRKDLYMLVRMPLDLIKKLEEEAKAELRQIETELRQIETESANESTNGNV